MIMISIKEHRNDFNSLGESMEMLFNACMIINLSTTQYIVSINLP